MTKRFTEILQYPDKRLTEKSRAVKKIDNDILHLFEDLEKLAKQNSKEGITLVGLSAPQLGLNVNAFVIYDFKKKKYIRIVNPKVVYTSKELSAEWEGCASVGTGQKSLFGPVRRAKNSQVHFTNIDGVDEILNLKDYMSHILLHEMDHLDGIIFLDRVEDPTMIMTAAELDDYAEKHGGNYPKIW